MAISCQLWSQLWRVRGTSNWWLAFYRLVLAVRGGGRGRVLETKSILSVLETKAKWQLIASSLSTCQGTGGEWYCLSCPHSWPQSSCIGVGVSGWNGTDLQFSCWQQALLLPVVVRDHVFMLEVVRKDTLFLSIEIFLFSHVPMPLPHPEDKCVLGRCSISPRKRSCRICTGIACQGKGE